MLPKEKVELASLILVGTFIFNVFICYWRGAYNEMIYPYNTYIYSPNDGYPVKIAPPAITKKHQFGDLFGVWGQTKSRAPYSPVAVFYVSNYPPFAHLLVLPFSWMPYDIAFWAFMSVSVMGFLLFSLFYLRTRGENLIAVAKNAVCLVMVTYPVHMVLDRGNMEGLVFFLLWLAICAYQKEHDYWASLFLAGSAASKMYPAMFALLFLAKRKWRPFVVFIAAACILTLVSAMVFHGGIAPCLKAFLAAMNNYGQVANAQGAHSIQHNSSLWILFAMCSTYLPDLFKSSSVLKAAYANYNVISGSMLIILSVVVLYFRAMPLWQKCALLTFAVILAPSISYDYKLIHLLIPFALFLQADTMKWESWYYCILFCFLLFQKPFYVLTGGVYATQALNPMIMLIAGAAIIVMAIRNRALYKYGP